MKGNFRKGKLRILILEDSAADIELTERELRKGGVAFSSKRVETREAFLKELVDFVPDLILADYQLPSFDGLAALAIVQEQCPQVPFIFVTGVMGEEVAIETLKSGATDYVLKSRLSKLAPAVHRALQEVKERRKRSQAKEALRRIEWLLTKDGKRAPADKKKGRYERPYGNLAELNTCRMVLNLVGEDVLKDIVSEYLDLLETSSAVYEKNGDYALGIFASGWCQLLDQASRQLCGTGDNREALDSGKWLCHESCWTRASNVSMETGQPVDIECAGGLRIYAVPIRAGDEIAGSINFGYGDPPQNTQKLQEISERYGIRMEKLLNAANAYDIRPPFIIDIAKNRLLTSARLIGTIIDLQCTEKELKRTNRALKAISACNEVLIHATDESELLQNICRLIVEIGAYRMCWVGYIEPGEVKTITAVAQAGFEDGYLRILPPLRVDAGNDIGPIRTAISTGKPSIFRNIALNPDFPPWREEALKRGYASALGLPLIANSDVLGALGIYASEPDAFDEEDAKLLMELADDMAYGITAQRTRTEHKRMDDNLKRTLERLRKTFELTVAALASALETRDLYTAGHQRRVSHLACAIAQEMNLTPEQIEAIRLSSLIHDIGKIHIPAEILAKPAALSEIEMSLVKTHPRAGYDILKDIEFPWPIAQIVLQHHERIDGSGYPLGLRGEDVMLEARILGIADVVEAMSSHRPYRPAIGLGVALEEINQKRGILYDQDVVDACLNLFYRKGFTLEAG
jgi:HD-GYP domain-containing protein (c-di-GMP phosphodiesterase class II)/CheY-like chemotaxis protein